MDGFEVCRRVRSSDDYGAPRILMLTAKGTDAERLKGIELGADAYVTKPFSTADLLGAVRELLEER